MASILLIDDNDELRSVTAELLRRAGHSVSVAADGKTGLALYRETTPDLVITDIVMPDMEGLELIAALRVATPRPRIIAISGNSRFSEPLYLPTAKHLGAQRTLTKPIQADQLLAAITAVLAEPAPESMPPPAT